MDTLLLPLEGQLPVDGSWFLDVNSFARHTGWLHTPFVLYAKYGVVLFALLLLASWWLARGARDVSAVAAALWAPLGALVALALNQPLVSGFREPRPYATLPHVLLLVSRSNDYSFPSDHAVMAGAVAAGVLLANRRLGIAAFFAALLMGFARVYVGAHYPGDVLVGLLFGAFVAMVGYAALGRMIARLVIVLARTPLRPLVRATPPAEPIEQGVGNR